MAAGVNSLLLLCSHSLWCSVFVLASPLLLGCLPVSVPCTDRRWWGLRLIRAHLLSWAGEREGYSSHNLGMWGVPVVVETCRKLLHSEASHALSRGNWPKVEGPSEKSRFIDSQEVFGSDLHLLIAWWPLQWSSYPSLGSQTTAPSHPLSLALVPALAAAGPQACPPLGLQISASLFHLWHSRSCVLLSVSTQS